MTTQTNDTTVAAIDAFLRDQESQVESKKRELAVQETNLEPEVAKASGAGVSALDCAIAMVAVSGRAQGIGQLFGSLVVGMARNPSMRGDLFTYTIIGMDFLELLAIVVILIAGMLLYSG